MKKLLSFLTAAAIALSAVPSVFAENTEQTEKILSAVKARIGSTEEYDKFNSQTYDDGGHTQYNFEWTSEDSDKRLYVSCNELGVITNYSSYDGSDTYENKTAFPKVSKEDVQKASEDFLSKINPDIKDQLIVDVDENNAVRGSYYISIEREIDGFKVYGDSGSIRMKNDSTEVRNYNLNYQYVQAPDKSAVISEEKAHEAFKEKLGMELVYEYDVDENGKTVYSPVYRLKDDQKMINALTGEAALPYEQKIFRNELGGSGASKNFDTAEDVAFSQAELNELENIKGLISKQDAEKSVRSNKYFDIGNLKMVRCSLYKVDEEKNEYIYSMEFTSENDSDFRSITLSANTGEVIHFSRDREPLFVNGSMKKDLKPDTAFIQTAAKALAGDKLDKFKYDDDGTYHRYENGIKVFSQYITVSAYDGVLYSYFINYDKDSEFKSADGAMSAEAAADKLFGAMPYEVYCYAGENNKTDYFYSFANNYECIVDPFSGEVGYGDTYVSEYNYDDLDNHWAKDIIETLAKYSIGLEGKQFKPDAKITVGEYEELLNEVFSYRVYATDAGTYLKAKNVKISDDFDENSTLTRESAAVLMVKAMGADEYADYDIYITPFGDVTEHKGYIALLSAMGVVSGDDYGSFNPNNELTRAEAAAMIYNYLNR